MGYWTYVQFGHTYKLDIYPIWINTQLAYWTYVQFGHMSKLDINVISTPCLEHMMGNPTTFWPENIDSMIKKLCNILCLFSYLALLKKAQFLENPWVKIFFTISQWNLAWLRSPKPSSNSSFDFSWVFPPHLTAVYGPSHSFYFSLVCLCLKGSTKAKLPTKHPSLYFNTLQ